METDFLGYLLQLDDGEVQDKVEAQMRSDPDLARRMFLFQKAIAPLEADREHPVPPSGLVARTIGRIAEHVCTEREPMPPEEADLPVGQILAKMSPQKLLNLVEVMDRANTAPSRGRRPDLVIAGSIAVIALGLILAAVAQVRHRQNIIACQNQMREYHLALQTYSETHNGKFPRVDELPPFNTASSFVPQLRDSGTLPFSMSGGCPTADGPSTGYAYTLGYREDNQLFGLRNDADASSLPILADRPPRDGMGTAHPNGQNVLFVDGHVNFFTTARVGRDADIYHNDDGLIGAGKRREDTVLGIGADHP